MVIAFIVVRLMQKVLFFMAFLITVSFASNAQQKAKTKILVLGTPHLEQIEGFESVYLKKLLDSLKHKKFDVDYKL